MGVTVGAEAAAEQRPMDDNGEGEKEVGMIPEDASEWFLTDPPENEGKDHVYVNAVRDPRWLEHYRREVTEERQRSMVESFIKGFGLVRHHTESFDRFVEQLIPRIIREHKFQTVDSVTARQRHVLIYGHTTTLPACVRECNGLTRSVQVQECRLRGLTLTVPVVVDVTYRVLCIAKCTPEALMDRTRPEPVGSELMNERVFRETLIGELTVPDSSRLSQRYQSQCLSGEDPTDQGGFFTINGSDKVIICEEAQRTNFPLVTLLKNHPRWYATLQVRSRNAHKVRSTSNLDLRITHPGRDSGTKVLVQVPYFNNVSIPLVALYRLLGVDGKEQMVAAVLEHRVHRRNLPLSAPDTELEELLREIFSADEDVPHDPLELREWVAKLAKKEKENTREKRIKGTDTMLHNEFLPHVGLARDQKTVLLKVHYLSWCVFKLLMVFLKRWAPDDRDQLQFRRVSKLDVLMAQLFRARFRGIQRFAHRRLKQCLEKGHPININWLINHRSMTTSFKAAISTGNFATQKNGQPSSGASMVVPRQTMAAKYSAMRRVHIRFNKDGKITKPRHLSPTHPPMICIKSTPEGSMCGLNKEISILTWVRTGNDPELVISWLDRLPRDQGLFVPFFDPSLTDYDRAHLTKVSVDDAPVGYSRQSLRLFRTMDAARRRFALPMDCSLIFHPWHRTLKVTVDPGCLMHLMTRVAGWSQWGRLWELPPQAPQAAHRERILEGIRLGVFQFVSKDEEETLRTAWLPDMVMLQFDTVESKQRDLLKRAQRLDGWVKQVLGNQTQAHRQAMACRYGEKWNGSQWTHRRPLTTRGLAHWRRSFHFLQEASYEHLQPITHVLVHPSTIMAVCALLLVFPHNNQGPRNMYGVAHQKAAISNPPLSSAYRMDAMSIRPWYAQMPLVQTFYDEILNSNEAPQGINCEVWISEGKSYNQEDAVGLNESFVQRGGFNNDIGRRSQDEEKKRTSDGHIIARPTEHCRGLKQGNYKKVALDGITPPGTRLQEHDITISKQIATFDMPENSKQASIIFPSATGTTTTSVRGRPAVSRDASQAYKSKDGRVEKTMWACSRDGNKMTKMITREPHKPQIGDKFSTRQGQKGTMGMIFAQEDMPFSITGRTPDLILNPHAFPSRMTTGTLHELLLGTLAAHHGWIGDGTPWNGNHVEDVCAELVRCGFHWNGRETVFSGITGQRQVKVRTFMGIAFVQSQKHLAALKNHARGNGPMQDLTHQPTEGRGKEGGLRVGEMERDCIIGHGASGTIKDRLLDQSDAYECPMCCKCENLPAQPAPAFRPSGSVDKPEPFCRICQTGDYVIYLPMPYCFKLVTQELQAMCIKVSLSVALVGPNDPHPERAKPLWQVIDECRARSQRLSHQESSFAPNLRAVSEETICLPNSAPHRNEQQHRLQHLEEDIARAWEREETQKYICEQINERVEKRRKRKEAQLERAERKRQRLNNPSRSRVTFQEDEPKLPSQRGRMGNDSTHEEEDDDDDDS